MVKGGKKIKTMIKQQGTAESVNSWFHCGMQNWEKKGNGTI